MAWRGYLLNNLGWKLVSLCLAILIWYSINSVIANKPKVEGNGSPFNPFKSPANAGQVSGEFENVPITVRTPAENTRVFKLSAQKVRVVLSGERERVSALSVKDIRAEVDLTGLPELGKTDPKTNAFPWSIKVRAPDGITVVKVDPAAVLVEPVPPPTPAPATKPTEKNQ